MILSELKIHNVRNISSARLLLHPRFNFITGNNGSGKTSLLEALYLLSCGHSFRSREISPIISHGQTTLTVFARGMEQETISIQKSLSEPTQIKLNNQFCTSTSQVAYAIPCQIFYADLFQIIDAGPSVRRSILDWGLFHVKHNYLAYLKDYKRVLKHRNVLLKRRVPYVEFIPWDKQLSNLSEQINRMRKEYFEQLQHQFSKVLNELSLIDCSLSYFKGWDKKDTGKSLADVLAEHIDSDKHKMYTQYGAHQADIILESHTNKVKHVMSRGQQKIILMALKLAQADLLDQECLYLIDDLAAEMDITHQERLMDYLKTRKGQYIITSTDILPYINKIDAREYYAYELHQSHFKQIQENVSRET